MYPTPSVCVSVTLNRRGLKKSLIRFTNQPVDKVDIVDMVDMVAMEDMVDTVD